MLTESIPSQICQSPSDYGHSLIGLICGLMPRVEASLVAIGFMLYEMNRTKTNDERFLAYEQFGLGFLVGKVVGK